MFEIAKYLFTFQVGDFDYQGCPRGVFLNHIYKLNRIIGHGHSSQ